MGVTEDSIIHRTWQLIPCINTLDTKVLQCSQLVYFSYSYDLLLHHIWLSCNCISICFYLFIYTASLFMWLFVFASFSVLCPSAHIFYICYCSCKTLFMCVFHHPFWTSAFLHDFLSTDLVISFSVCVYVYHSTSVCVLAIAFVADCMPVSFSFTHPRLMNSFFASGRYTLVTALHGVW
jgi:hypothetical protein